MKTTTTLNKTCLLLLFIFAFIISVFAQAPSKQWDIRFGGYETDIFSCLQQTSDGGYIFGGYTASFSGGDITQNSRGGYDYWIVKTDAFHVKQWDARFGGDGYEQLSAIEQTTDGGYILGGYSSSGISEDKTQDSRGGLDYWIVKTDANGAMEWDKRFGGDGDDALKAVEQTSDGGYILGGFSSSGISGDKSQESRGGHDFWMVKTDGAGVMQWDARFGGDMDDDLQSLRETAGGYIMGGPSLSGATGDKSQSNLGGYDFWIVKTNSSGSLQSEIRFGGLNDDELFDLQSTADGGYIFGGASSSGVGGDKLTINNGGYDYWIVKTDGSLNMQWDSTYGGSSHDQFRSVKQTSDGGYILGGLSYSVLGGNKSQGSYGAFDYWVVKTSSNGTQQWDKAAGGIDEDGLSALQQTNDGGYILGGSSHSFISGNKSQNNRGGSDYWMVKLAGSSISQTWYQDFDNDGYGNEDDPGFSSSGEFDAGYSTIHGDCNDDAESGGESFYPGATEVCNNDDDDCDGNIDEGLPFFTFYFDNDFDGYGIAGNTSVNCSAPYGYAALSEDCDDDNNSIYPGAPEICNTVDDDCDALIDADDPSITGQTYWYADADSDDFGDMANLLLACSEPEGYVSNNTDCDDNNATVNPAIVEIPGGADDNCNTFKDWDVRFGGASGDLQYIAQQTSDGGYITGGLSFSDSSGDKSQNSRGSFDYWILKTTSNGVKEWDARFGGDNDDRLYTMQQTSDDGYILGGWSQSGISGDRTQNNQGIYNDYWLVKTDESGNKTWDARFGGDHDDELNVVQQTGDGGYILGGSSLSGLSGDKSQDSRGNMDYWMVKINSTGVKEWDARFGGNNNDKCWTLCQTNDGGYLLGGESSSGISGDKTENNQGVADFWIVKTDSTGVKQWDKRFGGNDGDALYDVQQTPDGGYILGGWSFSGMNGDKTQPGLGEADLWMIKVDSAGTKLWDASFGGNDFDIAHSLLQNNDGGYILGSWSRSGMSGDKTSDSRGGADYWIVTTDADGQKLSDFSFGGSNDDFLEDIQPTSDNGFVIGGSSASNISGEKSQDGRGATDFWMLKVTGSSTLQTFYADADEDGFGNVNVTIQAVTVPEGYVTNSLDCDDTDANIYPGTTEIAGDGIDQNCDGMELCFTDADDDGARTLVTISSIDTDCLDPNEGELADTIDCNDGNENVYPGAADLCNTIDDNCDGTTDENAITVSIVPEDSVSACKGDPILFTATGTNIETYQWYKGANPVSGQTNATYAISYGSTTVSVIAANSYSCSASSNVTTITRLANVNATITILNGGNLDLCLGSVKLRANGGAVLSWQWYLNGDPLPGVTARTYTVTAAGNYKVKLTNNNTGCSSFSSEVAVINSCKEFETNVRVESSLSIYPNPTNGRFIINLNLLAGLLTENKEENEPATIEVINTLGQIVYSEKTIAMNGTCTHEIYLNEATAAGMYLVRITVSGKACTQQVVVQK